MWSWPTSRAAYGLKAAKPSARVDQQNDVRVLNTQLSYDRLADEYVRRIYDELKDKPLDCQLLDQFSTRVQGNGRVCDLGCGPGHLARYLRDRGVEIFGVDLSAELVERARRLNPGIEFRQGDMYALEAPDQSWAGIVAFYSIIHIPRIDHAKIFVEMRRVLRPAGLLLLAFHLGDEVMHFDELWGSKVALDFYLFRCEAVADSLRVAGFEVEQVTERDPYPQVEAQTRRGYIFARRSEEEQ
jgi:SAM-dependent methyltransferase